MGQNWLKHDYNARNDDDILELRAEYGWKGYGLFWAFIETMSENEKGAIDLEKIGGLSIGYNLPKDELLTFIETCLNIGLFYKDEDGMIRNFRATRHVEKMNTFKEAGKKGAEKRWSKQTDRGASGGVNATPNADKTRLDKIREDKKYSIPTREDVEEYFEERGDMIPTDIPLEATKFVNHYEEREWKKSNGNRIKYWKKQASTWNTNYQQYNEQRLNKYEQANEDQGLHTGGFKTEYDRDPIAEFERENKDN